MSSSYFIHDVLVLKQTFVRFMRGRHPQTIVTDINSGLRDAILRELPNTKHVISTWHILSKLSSWFSAVLGSQYGDFKVELDMLCQLESMDEFEQQWNLMLARFGLAADKHVALLFSYRNSWPISFIRGHFLAHVMTAEYSKSVDTFMKRILSLQTRLQVFFEQVSWSYKNIVCWIIDGKLPTEMFYKLLLICSGEGFQFLS